MNAWESYRRLYSDDLHPDVLTVVHNLAGGDKSLPFISTNSLKANFMYCGTSVNYYIRPIRETKQVGLGGVLLHGLS
jgi:hypothetical protein